MAAGYADELGAFPAAAWVLAMLLSKYTELSQLSLGDPEVPPYTFVNYPLI